MEEMEVITENVIDTLTGEVCNKSVLIKSGARRIFISIDTLEEIVDFLKKKGVNIGV